MNYITVREAAEKWNISLRLVQKLCTEGRVPGAQKFGSTWAIPVNTDKPADLRRTKLKPDAPPPTQSLQDTPFTMMPLMNTPFRPGQCREAVENMADSPQEDLAWAEYYYFSAQAEKAAQAAERYLTSPDLGLRGRRYQRHGREAESQGHRHPRPGSGDAHAVLRGICDLVNFLNDCCSYIL